MNITVSKRTFYGSLIKRIFNVQSPIGQKPKLVIIGSGWAGFRLLKNINKKLYDVSLVSPRNYFTFTPLLPSASVGTLELRCAIEPVRNNDVTFYEATCNDIDFHNNIMKCKNATTQKVFDVSYDTCVIACGSVPNTFNIPGVYEYANFLKDIGHARNIRQKLIQNLELASQPTTSSEERKRLLNWCIIGGGPTGVEFCAELFDFVKDDVLKLYPELKDDIKISLYDVAPRILPSFDKSLSNYTMDLFKKRGIKVNVGKAVTKVEKTHFELNDGSSIPFGLLLWSTGLGPNDLIKNLDLLKDRSERVITDYNLHPLTNEGSPIPSVYAVGDCAVVQDYDLPPTAQVAKQKAEYVAKVLNQTLKSQDCLPGKFIYKHRGSMAYIGDWKAIVETETSIQKGTFGWFIWRGAYISMTESLRNKIKIPSYWVLTWLFGREVSKF